MSDKRYALMFLRLGLLASVLFAAFWGVWQLTGHQVPMNVNLKFTESAILTIPFSLSRWWDVPLSFFMVNFYAWVLRIYYEFSLKFYIKEDIFDSLICSFLCSAIVSIFVSLIDGLAVALLVSLAVSIVISLFIGIILCPGLGVGTGFIIIGLGVSLGLGFIVGIGVSLLVGLIVISFGVGLCSLFNVLLSCNFLKSIYNWFAVKNIT